MISNNRITWFAGASQYQKVFDLARKSIPTMGLYIWVSKISNPKRIVYVGKTDTYGFTRRFADHFYNVMSGRYPIELFKDDGKTDWLSFKVDHFFNVKIADLVKGIEKGESIYATFPWHEKIADELRFEEFLKLRLEQNYLEKAKLYLESLAFYFATVDGENVKPGDAENFFNSILTEAYKKELPKHKNWNETRWFSPVGYQSNKNVKPWGSSYTTDKTFAMEIDSSNWVGDTKEVLHEVLKLHFPKETLRL